MSLLAGLLMKELALQEMNIITYVMEHFMANVGIVEDVVVQETAL